MVDPSQSVDSGFGFLTDLIGIQMRNMEAIRQAQQKMLEGMGVFAKRQTEIIEGTLRRSVSEPSAVTAPDIRSVVGHQIESLKNHDPGKSGELEHPLGDGGAQRR